MRKVRREYLDIADMNPLESNNKLVTCHSWFASPLLNLQADADIGVRNGGAPWMPPRYLYLDLPKHVMSNVSRFCLRAHTLAVESSTWHGGNGQCDKCSCAAVQNEVHDPFNVNTSSCLCALSGKIIRCFFSFLPLEVPVLFWASGPVEAPCILRALPCQITIDEIKDRIFDFLS